jgi:hypothetical protein
MAREQDMKQTRKKHGAAFKAKVEQAAVEIQPQSALVRFTRRVHHRRPG